MKTHFCLKRRFTISLLLIFLSSEFICSQNIAVSGDFYRLKKTIEVEGRQGIAVDEQFYYVSGSTGLYKYTKEGELVAKNEAPFDDFSKNVNHFGDIDVNEEGIITGVEHFDAGEVKNIQIGVYDKEDLSFKKSIDFENMEQPEVAGITVDKDRNNAWMVDWTKGNYIYKYDLDSEEYTGKIHLQPSPQWQQGAFFSDGSILITADDGDADLEEPDHIYKLQIIDSAHTSAEVSKFRTMHEFKRPGEIEGLSIDPTNHDLLILNNRGAIIEEGMPSGYYPGYDREIHELYIFERIK